jgi:hypothetical protein
MHGNRRWLQVRIFGLEALWQSNPSSAEIKNGGAILHLSHTSSWNGAELSKPRDKLIFYIQESLFHRRI